MRGTDEMTGALFSFVDIADRIPARHPLRNIRQVVNDALASQIAEFGRHSSTDGTPRSRPGG